MSDAGDFQAPPWWKFTSDDYTRHRSGSLGYTTMDALIGRKDTNKYKLVTTDPATVSGAGDLLTS